MDGEEDVAEAYEREEMRVVKVGWVLDEGWPEDMVAAIRFCFGLIFPCDATQGSVGMEAIWQGAR